MLKRVVRRVGALRAGGSARRSQLRGDEPIAQPPMLQRLIMKVLTRHLADTPRPVVAVIGPDDREGLRQAITAVRPEARILTVDSRLAAADLHVMLAAAGPADLLIDRSARRSQPARLADLVGHVRRGGVVIARLSLEVRRGSEERRTAYRNAVSSQLSTVGAKVALRGSHVVVVNGRDVRPIIREEQVAALLTAKPNLGRVVTSQPAVEVHAAGGVSMNDPGKLSSVPRKWMTIPLALREYVDVVSSPGQVLTAGDLILPESFRHLHARRLGNRWLEPVSLRFAGGDVTPPRAQSAPQEGPRALHGSYFHLDNELRGHFGHTTTEVISKLWGWELAKEADPDLKALIHTNKRGAPAEWEWELMEAGGVAREDVVLTAEPVRVQRIIGATPMFGNPKYIHPDLTRTWRRISDRLAERSTLEAPERIFVSRRLNRRACRNRPQLEALFEACGYTVVYPEDWALHDQVRMFRSAQAVAGFAGSGMFGLMWATEPKPVTLVSSEIYPARNEFLISGLLGHDVAIVWCPAENEKPMETRDTLGIVAHFTFDFDRDGEFVREAASRTEA